MRLMVISLFLFITVVLLMGFIVLYKIHKAKQKEIGIERNQLVIGQTEVRIGIQEVKNLFFDDRMDQFLRSNYPSLKKWCPVNENRVGEHWEGDHTIRLYFFNGEEKKVKVTVPEEHLTPQLSEAR